MCYSFASPAWSIRIASVALSCFSALSVSAQSTSPTLGPVYVAVHRRPVLPSGDSSFVAIEQAIRQRLVYTSATATTPASSPSALTFIIDAKGNTRGAWMAPGQGAAFERAVLAAVAKLPRFKPGTVEGVPVAVSLTLDMSIVPSPQRAAEDPHWTRIPPQKPGVEKWAEQPAELRTAQGTKVSIYEAVTQQLVYPPEGSKTVQKGTPMVSLSFTISPKGNVTDLLILQGTGLAYDRAAVQALERLPRFKPAQQDGQPVAVYLEHTVTFPRPAPASENSNRPVAYVPTQAGSATPAIKAVRIRPTEVEREEPKRTIPPKIYAYVEQMPVFPGGSEALRAFIEQGLRYPADARAAQVQGQVFVKFVIQPNGSISDAHVIKSLSKNCDAEALRVVNQLPRFTPGKQNGEEVAVYWTLPVAFFLTPTK